MLPLVATGSARPVASHHIHWPQFSMDTLNGSSTRGPVGDGLASFDWSVGQVMDAVSKAGIAQDTLTLLTGDNGGYILTPDWNCGGVPAPGGTNGALRCGKGTTFEGGHRLPGIAHWPGRIAPSTVTLQMASHLDVLPTLCALVEGCELPAGKTLDGTDVSSLLLAPDGKPEPPSPRKAFFYYATSKHGARALQIFAYSFSCFHRCVLWSRWNAVRTQACRTYRSWPRGWASTKPTGSRADGPRTDPGVMMPSR